jgi:RimJ/RimL family protein N-acetyltransferase
MSDNSYGKIFKITTFGESHGKAVGVVVDGCPSGLELSEEDIQLDLNRRRPGQSKITTPRNEMDTVEILSGVFEGKTTGSPICMIVFNQDHRSSDYDKLKSLYRPGHADLTFDKKYGNRDPRGGGRTSARIMIGRVAAGAIAKKFLKQELGIDFLAYTNSVGEIDLEKEIQQKRLKENFESDRLLFTPIDFDYLEDIYNNFTPEVAQYINPNVSAPKEIKETAKFISDSIIAFNEIKTLTFVVLDKKSKEFIGLCSLNNTNTAKIYFGLWVKKESQQKGYGFEIVKTLKSYALQNLDFKKLIYRFEKNNFNSQKLAEKMGGKKISTYKEKSHDHKTEFEWVEYSIPFSFDRLKILEEIKILNQI